MARLSAIPDAANANAGYRDTPRFSGFDPLAINSPGVPTIFQYWEMSVIPAGYISSRCLAPGTSFRTLAVNFGSTLRIALPRSVTSLARRNIDRNYSTTTNPTPKNREQKMPRTNVDGDKKQPSVPRPSSRSVVLSPACSSCLRTSKCFSGQSN